MIDSANCPLCCILLFPLQQACQSHRLLYVVLVVLVVFHISARRRSNDGQLFLKKLPQKVVLCCFPFSRLVWAHRLLYVVLVVLVVFHISARRRSKDGLLFLKKLPQKLFFVVSLAAGLSEFSGCYTLYLLFKLFSIYQQEGAARTGCFSWKSCRKSCSLLFPLQQACLSSQVVIRCTCCSSCFPYISKKTQYKVLTNRLTRD